MVCDAPFGTRDDVANRETKYIPLSPIHPIEFLLQINTFSSRHAGGKKTAHKKRNLFGIGLKWGSSRQTINWEQGMKINETPEKKPTKIFNCKRNGRFFFVWPFRIRFACVFNLFYHVPCLEDSHFFCLCVDSYINLFDSVSCIIFGPKAVIQFEHSLACLLVLSLFECVCESYYFKTKSKNGASWDSERNYEERTQNRRRRKQPKRKKHERRKNMYNLLAAAACFDFVMTLCDRLAAAAQRTLPQCVSFFTNVCLSVITPALFFIDFFRPLLRIPHTKCYFF